MAELDPIIRILYAGLWCYADREGRFEWRTKRIKALILPYDNVEIEALLNVLIDKKFIMKYSVASNFYGFIPTFLKHQNPHPHEAKSQIPEPSENIEENQCHDMSLLVTAVPCNVLLTPSSLTPSSLTPSSNFMEVVTSIVPEAGASGTGNGGKPAKGSRVPECPHQEIMRLYREILPELPQIEWNDDRALQLRTRWREKPERRCLDWWKSFFELVRQCPWLMGENEKGWIADLEWLTRKKNLPKVLDGKYKARDNGTGLTKVGQRNKSVAEAYLEKRGLTR
ncbi:MAG: hypothetical protein WC455_20625 [Dehalococcoidia bacterium]